jgi:hypothetical protein
MPSTEIKDYWRRAWGIGDRQPQRRLKAAGPLLLAPYLLPYAAAFIGTTATGLMAQQKIQNYFENNPDAIPKFKEWVSKFGTLPGDQPELEEELKELSKPVGGKIETWEGSYKDKGTPIPDQEKIKPPVDIPPQIKVEPEGFPDLSEELNKPQIFTFAKDKKEVKKKLDDIEPYGGADVIGKSTQKDRTKEIEFLEAFIEFKNKYYGGNEKAAIEKGLGLNREKIRGIIVRTTTKDRRTGKISTVQEEIITTEVPENPIRYIDATTAVKKDPNYFKNFLTKENKNDYLSAQNIANTLGFKFQHKSERDQFTAMLKELGVKQKEVPGKRYTSFKLSDVVNKLTEKNKRKIVKGDVLAPTRRLEIENKLDADLYSKILSASKSRTNSILKSQNLKLNLKLNPGYAVDDIGHVVSIKETDKFPKLFKNSDVNKINSLVYEDPLINQDVKKVTGYEKRYKKFFEELESLVGKDITAADRKKLMGIRKGMEENYLRLIDTISNPKKLKAIITDARPDITISDEYIKYLTSHVNRIAKIDIKIPQIGEKFKSEDIFTDMSNVDERYIIGYIDKINPTAKKFKDLSRSEKETYEANILAQNAEIVGDFYKKLGFSANEIKELKDDFYYPMTEYKIRKAGGGPVGLSGVDQYIINRGI